MNYQLADAGKDWQKRAMTESGEIREMIGTIFPGEAVKLSQQLAVKYQTSSDQHPGSFVEKFMAEIEPVLNDEACKTEEYLSKIRGHAKLERQQQNQDRLSQRRREFYAAVEQAVDAKLNAR